MKCALPLLLLSALFARGDTIELRQGNASLQLSSPRLTADGRKMPLSDLLRIVCRVETGDGEWELDPLDVNLKLWNVKTFPRTEGEQSWSFDPLRPGRLPLPTFTLRYRESRQQPWTVQRWSELTMDVLGPRDKTGGEIRGELPLETLPEAPSDERRLPIPEGILLLTTVAALVLIVRRVYRPRQQAALSADTRAFRELEKLTDASERGEYPGQVHARVSGIVRRYLEERYGLPAPRLTTEEVLPSLQQSGQVPDEVLGKIDELCRICDRVKFAGSRPTTEEEAVLVVRAREIIEATRVRPVT